MKPKILISTTTFAQYDAKPLEELKKKGFDVVLNPHGRSLSPTEVVSLGSGAIGIIAGTESLNAEVLSSMNSLKVISRCGVGMDNVDLVAAKKKKIEVLNTPGAPTRAVAELVIGLILDLLRHISVSNKDVKLGVWKKRMGSLFWSKNIGIVGYGQIGRKVGELCRALGGHFHYYDPALSKKSVKESEYLEFDQLLKSSDIVTLHISYSKENHHLLGKKEFSLMKKGSFLMNCSRGGIIDEEALFEALKSGHLAGAALDVFEEEPYKGPLKDLDNVILTPHIGSYAKEARIQMEMEAVQNLIKGFEGVK